MDVLSGKAVVITGSGRGLGRAYAHAAAAEGAAVVVNDVDPAEARAVHDEIAANGARVALSEHSVDDPADAHALIELCTSSFGRIDALVNNAARVMSSPAWEVDPRAIAELVEPNIVGTMLCGIAAMEPMRAQKRGTIVNVISGAHLGIAGMSVYAATKGAVASLTYVWALELATDGIRVNGFSPLGGTRMTGGHGPDPALVAPAMVYVLSDAAAGLSGQIVRFDGSKLSLLSPPAYRGPFAERDAWDVHAVTEAADEVLHPNRYPVGLDPVDLRDLPA